MRIGIDIMGGDYAPVETVQGALMAHESLKGSVEIILLGDKEAIELELTKHNALGKFEIIHTSENIGMAEHPVKAATKKQDSSIVKGLGLLKQNNLDGFASAGNTGAIFVSSLYAVKNIDQVSRPALFSVVPQLTGGTSVLLDVGANSDCKPENLFEFGILGSIYAKSILNIENPRVGLLNIGEEEGKGNILTQAAYQLMKDTDKFNFIGNVEAKNLFNGSVDVMVCDGFTGNVVLKLTEGMFSGLKQLGFGNSDHSSKIFEAFNYENYGGTAILGLNAPVVIGHGVSKAGTIKNMLLQTKTIIENRLVDNLKNAFN